MTKDRIIVKFSLAVGEWDQGLSEKSLLQHVEAAGLVVVSRADAELISKVYLPANIAKARSAAPETREAVIGFRSALEPLLNKQEGEAKP